MLSRRRFIPIASFALFAAALATDALAGGSVLGARGKPGPGSAISLDVQILEIDGDGALVAARLLATASRTTFTGTIQITHNGVIVGQAEVRDVTQAEVQAEISLAGGGAVCALAEGSALQRNKQQPVRLESCRNVVLPF